MRNLIPALILLAACDLSLLSRKPSEFARQAGKRRIIRKRIEDEENDDAEQGS